MATITLKDTVAVEDYSVPEQGKLKNFEVEQLKTGKDENKMVRR